MRLIDIDALLEKEWKASAKLCKSSTPDSKLGASALSSCKSQGYRARDGKKSQSFKARRDESKGMEKAMGKRAYSPIDKS